MPLVMPLVASFRTPEALLAALGRARAAGHRPLDALTPFPVEGLAERLGDPPRAPRGAIRPAMLAAGLGAAALAYAVQWWSAVHDYPLNAGGRPLHSWPVFLLVPFEVGVLAAAVAGLVATLRACGLPRLHHPLFATPGIERASQDRFLLVVEPVGDEAGLRTLLEAAGGDPVAAVPR
jgi:hypothetical protein